MIVVKYKGGLGNQMFQYVMQLALEKRYPDQQVLSDVSHYMLSNEHNGFELERVWGIRLPMASRKQLADISPYYFPPGLVLRLPETVRRMVADNLQYKYKDWKLKRNRKVGECYRRQESHCAYEPELWNLERTKDWYLDGLWQNVEYFAGIEREVREAFRFRNQKIYTQRDLRWKEQILSGDSVSVHVRRGDFENSKFDICTPAYYRDALRVMDEELAGRGPQAKKYFFFTDDVAYVQKAFSDIPDRCKEIVHHETGNSVLDMELMSLCRHHIISNSTFAWWAAWLDHRPDTVTVAPAVSVRKPGRSYFLSAPQKWILLEV